MEKMIYELCKIEGNALENSKIQYQPSLPLCRKWSLQSVILSNNKTLIYRFYIPCFHNQQIIERLRRLWFS